jgi:hypothetical protein
MICDFGNPISMRYVEMSLESLKPLNDIITITPVQCTTPETLPIRYERNQEPIPFYVSDDGKDYLRPRHYGGTFCDDKIYNCIMHSHMQLIERIAQGEEILILEHDAALVNEESFREMLDTFWGSDIFFPGACMEFYSLSQRFASWMVDTMEDFPSTNFRFSGPMGVITSCGMLGFGETGNFLMPTKDRDDLDKICFSSNIQEVQKGIGFNSEPAFKQFYFTKTKNTNSPTYSDLLEDETLETSSSGPRRRDFILIDA